MSKKNYNYLSASIYGIIHLLVDFACVIGVFAGIGESANNFAYIVLLYNMVAFLIQPIIGWYSDKLNKYRQLLFLSCIFVLIGLCISPYSWLSVFIFGFGNALFHVTAGALCLNLDKRKTAFAGIFVAPGDVGLMAGTLIGKNLNLAVTHIFILTAVFFILIILILFLDFKNKDSSEIFLTESSESKKFVFEKEHIGMSIIIFGIIITVRAFIGSNLSFSWIDSAVLTMLLAVFISAGKAAGGIIADKIGDKFTGTVALLISSPFLAFLSANMTASIIGIFLFNMTMPLTMTAIFRKMPAYPAFSFGIAAMALLPGFYAGLSINVSPPLLLLIITITAGLLYYAFNMEQNGGKNE